jgi:glyoxylase-like metal-dependent hydrolase (beta-lactamase superfamily II)
MITLLPAGNPGPFTGPTGNNTWLVDGAEPLLVDAGVGHAAHLAALEAQLAGRPLARLFLTHAHQDHSSGTSGLRARWPGLEVLGGPLLATGGDLDGPRVPDGGLVTAGDGVMEVVATPGHSPDHACLWHPERRELFAGDLLIGGSTVMIEATSGGGLRGYLSSLAKVRQLQPARVYPGHGEIIDDPVALIDAYVAHRAERERQLLTALDQGPATVDALVRTIYPELAPAIVPAAAETLLAHLHKLLEEHAVMESGGIWRRSSQFDDDSSPQRR